MDVVQNSSLGAEPDTMPYTPKHLRQGKLKLVASILPQFYSLKRSLSKLIANVTKPEKRWKKHIGFSNTPAKSLLTTILVTPQAHLHIISIFCYLL